MTKTATENLRKLLNERGVEWRKAPHYSSKSRDVETIFKASGIEWYAIDHRNGRLGLRFLRYEATPEQVIEATLGRGTCRIRDEECNQCGAIIHKHVNMYWVTVGDGMRTVNHRPVRYCPNCGRKVVEL